MMHGAYNDKQIKCSLMRFGLNLYLLMENVIFLQVSAN